MYLEDSYVGQIFTNSSCQLSRSEFMELTSRYEPQYIHIHEEKANKSILK
jgi:hypothetical protein